MCEIHPPFSFSSVGFPWALLQLFHAECASEEQGPGASWVSGHVLLSGMWVLSVFGAVWAKFNAQPVQLEHRFIPFPSTSPTPTPLYPPPPLLTTTLYQHTHPASNGHTADVVVCERHFLSIRSGFGRETPVYRRGACGIFAWQPDTAIDMRTLST